MAYIAVKKVKGRYYAYRQESYREGGKVKTRVIEYLGAVSPESQKKIYSKKADSNLSSSESTENLKCMSINGQNVLVDPRTGELNAFNSSLKNTKDRNERIPFSFGQMLCLPNNLEKYGISALAIQKTHQRYGKRLIALGIDPRDFPAIKIRYGHPSRLQRLKDNSFVITVSRNPSNENHPINKSQLWANYRQALAAGYLDSIEKSHPYLYRDLASGLSHYHQETKKILLQCIKYAPSSSARLVLSLQLFLWNKLPHFDNKKVNPEEFGQVDFSMINDWRAEAIHILSDVQKSGWEELSIRNKKARTKLKSAITRKRNLFDSAGLINRISLRVSGKRRRLVKEIMDHENRLRAIDNLEYRIKFLKESLDF